MIIIKTKHFSLMRFNAQLLYRSDFKRILPQNREEKKKTLYSIFCKYQIWVE